jgi:ABC-type lipoprotein release transport system permease subunit
MKDNTKTNLIIIAYRNLYRHKVKTIITVIAVAIGVSLFIFIDSWLYGMNIDSRRNIVNFETGSAKIYSRAYYSKIDEKPMYESFNNYEPILAKLYENGYNTSVHSVFPGSLKSQDEELPFEFIGIDPEKEKSMFLSYKFVSEGKYPESGNFEILIGYLGAKNLKVKAGDTVKLITVIDKRDNNGIIRHINQVIDLKVCGIINSPNPKTNGNVGYIPLDVLQDELGILLEGSITEICIRKKNPDITALPGKDESAVHIKKILGDTLPRDLVLIDWIEDVKDYVAASSQDIVSNNIIIGLLFLLAFIGIANTMLMAVLERTKEIGMLRALGMKDFSILKLFVYEAGLIGLIGSVIGIILGVLINLYMVNYGIDYTKMLEQFGTDYGYRVVGIFKSAWNIPVIFMSGIIATLISALTAILPTLKALKMSIVDALRFE